MGLLSGVVLCVEQFRSSSPSPHLIEDLQIEGVHPRWHCALDHLVPAWVLGSVVSGWCFIDCISQSDPAVRIHPCHTIVFSQFGLCSKTNIGASISDEAGYSHSLAGFSHIFSRYKTNLQWRVCALLCHCT